MLRTLLTLLALLPALAAAEPARTYGVAFQAGGKASRLEMSMCEATCFAQVRFENTFLRGGAYLRQFPLDLDGLAVTVTIVDGEGMAPELFTVEPPPGYRVEPAEIPVEEGASGTIALIPLPVS